MHKKIKYIDGIRFYRALVVGINNLISRQDHLNQINVFPVPGRIIIKFSKAIIPDHS